MSEQEEPESPRVISVLPDEYGHAWPGLSPGDEPGIHDACLLCGLSGFQALGQRCSRAMIAPARLLSDDGTASWWESTTKADLDHALEKAEEYGSADLEIMGKAMEALFPGADRLDPESLRRAGLEMAIAFYQLGKSARLFGAYARGTLPRDDTWHDATVYPMMARRVRETGMWP